MPEGKIKEFYCSDFYKKLKLISVEIFRYFGSVYRVLFSHQSGFYFPFGKFKNE